jgi:hypothetical protein
MKTARLRISSTFHLTEITVRVPIELVAGRVEDFGWYYRRDNDHDDIQHWLRDDILTEAQIQRVESAICGVTGCQCGSIARSIVEIWLNGEWVQVI